MLDEAFSWVVTTSPMWAMLLIGYGGTRDPTVPAERFKGIACMAAGISTLLVFMGMMMRGG